MKLIALGVATIAAVAVGSPVAAACATSDIHIKNWNWRVEHRYAVTVRELTNGCSEPTGVQLQLVFRDGSGNAIDADEFWPASSNNIAPGASFVFKWVNEWNPTAKSATVTPISVRQW
ncbi:MAG: hypothetical protein ABR878_13225 [Roseiarcus sp.]|jgi:hypothetical protein